MTMKPLTERQLQKNCEKKHLAITENRGRTGRVVKYFLLMNTRACCLAVALSAFFAGRSSVVSAPPAATPAPANKDTTLNQRLKEAKNTVLLSNFPWKYNILTTTFWIGNNRNSYTTTVNYDSAWDTSWHENYGGEDDPNNRVGSRPKKFYPKLNPFYIALPFNDVAFPEKAAKLIPWYRKEFVTRFKSVCKDKWIAIHYRGKFCFGQWQDVGPFRVDNAEYVFGSGQPNTPTGAGLDVSPAIRDHLKLSGRDTCDWRFVDAREVPYGPWLEYGEKSLVLSQLDKAKREGRMKLLKLPDSAKNWSPDQSY